MEQEALFDHIDAYLWNLLSDDERKAFETNLANDEDLRVELALRRLENEALQLADKADLRTKMKAWRAEEAAETVIETTQTGTKVVSINQGRGFKFTPMRWAAAAAIALAVIFGGRYWATANYGNDVLAAEFYDKKGDNGEYYGAGEIPKIDADALLTEANVAFQAKNYAQAITLYQTILADNSVALNHTHEAEWKLLITDLAAGKTDAASGFQSLLAKLVNDNTHTFHKPALELNQKVNSFWWKITY